MAGPDPRSSDVALSALQQGSAAAGGAWGGASAAMRGLRTALANREVRQTYLQLLVALYITTVVLAGVLVTTLWVLTPIAPELTWAWTVFYWVLRIAGSLILAFASPLLALFTVNLVFPLLGERVFFAGMRVLDPARAAALEQREGMPLVRSLWMTVARMILFLGGTLLALAVTLIPLVGALLGPALSLFFTARAMTWELLDPVFDKRRMYLSAQREYIKQRQPALVGFGLPFSLLLSIPLVGPLFFGLAQAAVATLYVEVLELGGEPELAGDAPAIEPA
ncbi:MAG: EI24 domain-containing protein [Myxococcales bacterium]|nr:EI24 domain-containing protein [Myxococcales bacterium]MCB9750218.1 EI24 domain-containing protein [Myxococcales bacterium]